MISHVVTKCVRQTGLVDKLDPYDMRTCAKLCRESSGDPNSCCGHASVHGAIPGIAANLKEAVNDRRAGHMTVNPQFFDAFVMPNVLPLSQVLQS